MNLPRFLLLVLLLLPAQAFATPSAGGRLLCHTTISFPADGATAVPLDSVVTGSLQCSPKAPQFVDDTGATVAATFAAQGSTFTLTPLAPLAANRTYSVTFADHTTCGVPYGRTSFSTAAKPGIRQLSFEGAIGELHVVDVDLTEPVLHPADLAAGSTLVTTSVDGFAGEPPINPGTNPALSFQVYYKPLNPRPLAKQLFHIRLHKGLQFASGAVLADDLEVAVVPADLPLGWLVTGVPKLCDYGNVNAVSNACQARTRAGGVLGSALLALLALLVVARRRRTGPGLR